MSLLRRILGLGAAAPTSPAPRGDPASVRRIAAQLEALPPDLARQLAATAYLLARVAHADLNTSADEIAEMERIVAAFGPLPPAQAALVVELARTQAVESGGTENFLVSRGLREHSSREQRIGLVECLFALSAADASISTTESEEVIRIAEELGFSRREAIALRSRWRDQLAELQAG